jgi:hypothetical protein
VTEAELDLRRTIFTAFAETGAPPPASALDQRLLRSLAAQHVVVLDDAGEIAMAHPFARPPGGATVTSGGRTWSGNCAWDAFGIAAVLGLSDPRIVSHGVEAGPGVLFHVAVPARQWWDDIVHT